MYGGRFTTTAATVAAIFISIMIIIIVIASNNITAFNVPYSTISFAQISNQDRSNSSDISLRIAFTKLGVLGGIYQRIFYDSQTNTLSLGYISAAAAAAAEATGANTNTQGNNNQQDCDNNRCVGNNNQQASNNGANTQSTDSDTSFSSQQGSSSQSQSNKQISEADENNLKQTIYKNGFFEADSVYPPNATRPQNYTLYVLSIKMDGRLHTVLWADTSNNVPPGFLSTVQALQKVASK
jgi:hypothetical protein